MIFSQFLLDKTNLYPIKKQPDPENAGFAAGQNTYLSVIACESDLRWKSEKLREKNSDRGNKNTTNRLCDIIRISTAPL